MRLQKVKEKIVVRLQGFRRYQVRVFFRPSLLDVLRLIPFEREVYLLQLEVDRAHLAD